MLTLLSRYPTFLIFVAAVTALILSIVFGPLWISFLRRRGIGQLVREDGPAGHLQKTGTPTMGGFLILSTAIFSYLVTARPWTNIYNHKSLLVLLAVILSALVGFFDDWAKIRNARSLGIRARTKLLFEAGISFLIAWMAINFFKLRPEINIPLIDVDIYIGYLYYLFVFLVISGTSNSVNMTDGLDGLAAGIVMIVMAAYMAIAFKLGQLDLALFAGAIGGGCLGLLWYNAYPANIFMGDTGSLALGTGIATLAITTKTELFLPVIGGLFVIESLSVILQVASYRLTGKRIFKMAPIHHHFELLGWSETAIMIRFWIVASFFAGLGFGLFFITG